MSDQDHFWRDVGRVAVIFVGGIAMFTAAALWALWLDGFRPV